MSVRTFSPRVILVPLFALTLACSGANGEAPRPGGEAAGGGEAADGGEDEGWVEVKPEPAGDGPVLRLSGTVRHMDLEGGLYVIRDAEGTNYNPTNLPEAFRIDGLAVEAAAQARDDLMSIGMVGPMVDIVRIREREAPVGGHVPPTDGEEGLSGTAWVLDDLAGAGVVARATLVFAEDGTAGGHGSCNRFHGPVSIADATLDFGLLATTRMMCGEAVMNQEAEYLAALGEAERFELDGTHLYIHTAGRAEPLRFIAAEGPN
jgi:heat shock protein HslJ